MSRSQKKICWSFEWTTECALFMLGLAILHEFPQDLCTNVVNTHSAALLFS